MREWGTVQAVIPHVGPRRGGRVTESNDSDLFAEMPDTLDLPTHPKRDGSNGPFGRHLRFTASELARLREIDRQRQVQSIRE